MPVFKVGSGDDGAGEQHSAATLPQLQTVECPTPNESILGKNYLQLSDANYHDLAEMTPNYHQICFALPAQGAAYADLSQYTRDIRLEGSTLVRQTWAGAADGYCIDNQAAITRSIRLVGTRPDGTLTSATIDGYIGAWGCDDMEGSSQQEFTGNPGDRRLFTTLYISNE